jgi:UDP:flavonoid glycosyltransferase YjiC (YdhE family)
MGDQFYWAAILQQNGLGPAPVRYTDIEVDTLAEQMVALSQILYANNAEALAPVITAEDGVTVAADLLESLLREVA